MVLSQSTKTQRIHLLAEPIILLLKLFIISNTYTTTICGSMLLFSHPSLQLNSSGIGVQRIARRRLGSIPTLFKMEDISIDFDIQYSCHSNWMGGHVAVTLKRNSDQIWLWMDQECLALLLNRADVGLIEAHEFSRNVMKIRETELNRIHMQFHRSGRVTMGKQVISKSAFWRLLEPEGSDWEIYVQAENYDVIINDLQVTANLSLFEKGPTVRVDPTTL